jgi:hypothetical protein
MEMTMTIKNKTTNAKTINKTTISVMLAISVAALSIVPAFAVTSTGPWSITQYGSTNSCGTNFTDANEYTCAVPYSSGYSYLLAKVNSPSSPWTVTAFTRTNANLSTSQYGTSPEFTTSNSVVTFKSNYNLSGFIQQGSYQQAYVHYGHEVFKKNASGGWDLIKTCKYSASTPGVTSISNQDVSCTVNNSGTNTYRIAGSVDALAQTVFGSSNVVYADFYTGSYGVKLNSLTIT